MKFEAQSEDNRMTLTGAVLLYQSKSNMGGHELKSFATLHTVSMVGERPVIDSGRPLTQLDYADMVKKLSEKDRPGMNWLDDCLLAKGDGKTMWWTRPQMRPMFFKMSNMYNGTFEGQAVCPVPGMVWMATRNSLYVYAIADTERPTAQTPLFQAPFFNVWANGEVCKGNATLPDASRREVPKEWEKMLFESRFTHPNFTEKDRLVKGADPVKFWKQMIKKPTKVFPQEKLVEVKLKISDLMAADFETRAGRFTAEGEF